MTNKKDNNVYNDKIADKNSKGFTLIKNDKPTKLEKDKYPYPNPNDPPIP